MSERLQNIRLEIVTAKKDIESYNSEISFALSTEEGRGSRKAELQTEIDNDNSLISETERRIEALNNDINNLNEKVKALNLQIEGINNKKSELEIRSGELRALEKDKNNEREAAGRELARLEERRINLQKEYDNIIQKLWDEYQLTKNEAEQNAVEIENLTTAAPLHDIGKVGIHDRILRKPGSLTQDEREIMMQHPQMGYDVL